MNIDKFIRLIYTNKKIRKKLLFNLNFNKYNNLKNYLSNYYLDSDSFQETIYRIYYNLKDKPTCICGNKLKFNIYKYKYYNYCSIKCQRNDIKNIEKYKQTCLLKYGVDNPAKSKISIEHAKKTCKIRYNGNSPMSSDKVKNKLNLSKKEHNTFNTSIPEKESYKLLKEKYQNVITQYKSKLYPYCCDFYIPSLDLYIECNYHWTHGNHPFNENNINDKIILENWKNKNTQFYNNAIITWTIRDVNKRKIAKENNLNFIEFWNINELKQWIID